MSAVMLRKQISKRLKSLSEQRLKVVDDFLSYLQEREDNTATRELLAIPGFRGALRRAEREVDTGKVIPWSRVRKTKPHV